MERIISVLLALCMLLSSAVLADGAGESMLYFCDFSDEVPEWQPRGKETVLAVENGCLAISGRKSKSDSAVLDVALEAGKLYTFSVKVMQQAKNAAELTLTVEHKKQGHSSFTTLSTGKTAKGEWTIISGEWLADTFDSYSLLVTTVGNPTLDFCLDDVVITMSDPLHLSETVYEGNLPVLKDLSSGFFDFGTCISQADVHNTSRSALVVSQYNIITPENELKPDSVLDVAASRTLAQEDDTAVAVHFANAVPILKFAQKNGLKVHGHVLVWHSQTPEEFFHEGYDRNRPYVTREVMLARLDNYIRLVFEYMEEHYPGLIVSWDVANECVADGSSNLRASNWTKVVGEDFVCRTFEIADRYAPEGVLLYYNDYSTPYEPKLTGIVNLLTSLVAEGHIDGYGFQSHYASDTPTKGEVRKAFERITALGLKLRISELDITVTADTDSSRYAQAQRYADMMTLYVEYADVLEAVQVWGVCDGTSWLKEKHPLMLDAKLQPKPAFFSVAEVLRGEQ